MVCLHRNIEVFYRLCNFFSFSCLENPSVMNFLVPVFVIDSSQLTLWKLGAKFLDGYDEKYLNILLKILC